MGEMRHLFKATLDAIQYSFTKMTSLHITFLTSMLKLLYTVDMPRFHASMPTWARPLPDHGKGIGLGLFVCD